MKKRNADGTLKLKPVESSREVDRLSDLPDDLIGRVLGFLPTPQAVLTSRLSRRWRRVWPAHVRALNLSVYDGVGRRLSGLSSGALARFATPGIPSISLHIASHVDIATGDTWYTEAMEREALSLLLNDHGVELQLPPLGVVRFGRLAELALSTVRLPSGTPPLHEFLSACCPRLRRLRLCAVRGDAVRALDLRSDALESLDVNNVDQLVTLHVAAPNLRSLSVRSCFRFPVQSDVETEVVVSAPRMEAVCWYRSYPKRLDFLTADPTAHQVRRLSGLKLPTRGPSGRFDFPYTIQLLRAFSVTAEQLELDLILPDDMTLLNWAGQAAGGEDLLSYVPRLPRVSALSLNGLRWGLGCSVRPSLAELLSRVPNVTRLYVESNPYCRTVFVSTPRNCVF
ncbi:FBD-associated F-box protein At4g13985-like [Brachypodium distachyon]|uniref:FBD-associated F-box protein At4g13985-like n=1 Tax=Brachypodium distachyon TaxID=15368 RepID=UPI0005300139|nr:FBD-associated F-box protein At4g13985-like [Brachypodium distachyon]|eukprot:XP_024310417.1 FBD-associated F-box protein At4g13985-like [Brachypodium distachyon]